MSFEVPQTRQSSIVVAVRVRPFTAQEQAHLINEQSGAFGNLQLGDANLTLPGVEQSSTPTKSSPSASPGHSRFRPQGLRQTVDCVDDKMLIFDPSESNPLRRISETVLNSLAASSSQGFRSANSRRSGEQKFVFDRVFNMDSSQMEVYEATARPLLDSVLDGFNSTVFAYGATGCGKTYTVSGPPENPGIIFLTMQELFAKMEEMNDKKRFELTASYLEIYNETIRDLLQPETSSKKLVLFEDAERHITVANLSHHPLKTVQDVMDLVIRGNNNRTTSATDANETSSRSHAVLQVHIAQRNRTAELKEDQKFATLSLIDLAGSERASATKNRGERLHEGANINRSLLALGNCINALCVNGKRGASCHVPYRDSKLTRLLKFSLGGNCKTVMIVCVSPGSNHYDETLNTLKYATRAKDIKTKLIRNRHSLDRHVGSYLKMITEQRQEIEELRSRERKVIDLEVGKYRISRERIHMAIWDSVQGLRNNYRKSEKFQHLKIIKSLILCKRRFLQMIRVELEVLLKFSSISTELHGDCSAVYDQLGDKIRDLEDSFDASDELDSSLEHTREVDLTKLQEMENWDEGTDLVWYESLLSWISEAVRTEILVCASTLMEKLMQDETLIGSVKFISETLLGSSQVISAEEKAEQPLALDLLHQQIRRLVHVDDEFDAFAERMRDSINSRATTDLGPASAHDWCLQRTTASTLPQRSHNSAKVGKANSGSPSPVQRSRPPHNLKPAKKVRWSELVPESDSVSMMLDDENPSTTAWACDEDISMQDLPENCTVQSITKAARPTGRDGRKMSLTATALVRDK
ncbi:LADA_0G15346g1_1 [Lachancea dasiensis]|uniref:Kinesin-like protein n=1 Tax=Lachancea dasiensis TaxID=1072105 RepID=A0A1G4JWQ3_9SACH|nr:LADA_0G15346g1_1 [Lachancea dasiensis]